MLVLVGGDLGEELRIRFDAEGLVGPELAVGRSGDRIESGSRLQAQASPERQAVMAGAAWWTNLFEHS